MRHYCTMFDRNYAARGLALHRSLVRHCGEFKLYVLCLDAATRDALAALSLQGIEPIDTGELERADPALRDARTDRAPLEYYFTCKPVLLRFLMERDPSIGRLDYLDADLGFFSDPAPLEQEYAGSAVALSPHAFAVQHAAQRRYGEFNAGWLSVSTDAGGREFVAWWRERCLEWCRLSVEATRFGDQKYLDQVPRRFPRAVRISHPGANLAPWNVAQHAVELAPSGPLVDSRPLVFYHFHGMKRMLFGVYESGLHEYGATLTAAVRRGIYRPYLRDLAAGERSFAALPRAQRDALASPRGPSLRRRVIDTARTVLRHSAVGGAI